jgi:hypothetical protein
LYSTRTVEKTIPRIRESEKQSHSSAGWWGMSRKDNSSESHVQRNRLRLHGNQWF